MSFFRACLFVAAALLASACGSSSSTTAPSGPSVSIVSGASTMTTTAYSPNPMTVSVGSALTWVNNDNTAHTATGASFNTGTIGPGQSSTVTFSTAGNFTYHCSIHPNMVGTVNVQ